MKKIIASMLATLLVIFTCSPFNSVQAAETDIVNIPDSNLLEGLKDQLDKPFTTSLTEGDLAQLEYVDAGYSNPRDAFVPGKVSNLTGLEYAVNITKLNFSSSKVADITPIIYLPKLKSIVGVDTSLASIEGIQNLPSLESLELGADYIEDFSPLLEAEGLKDFSYNSYNWLSNEYSTISDVSIFSKMKNLETLDLTWNEVKDLSPLRDNRTIKTLNLTHNSVESLTSLAEMKALQVLYLDENNLYSLDDLSTLEGMRILYANSNHITDVSALNHLFETMLKGDDDYKGLQINNQTITLPAITVQSGGTAVSNNPTRGLDNQVMDVQSVSNNGYSSTDSKQISWDNVVEDTTVTYNIAHKEKSAAGVDFSYSLKVTQPIKVAKENSKQVTVKHQDGDGNKLADDDVFTVNTGDTYQTEAKTIEGYQVARIEGEPTGTMGTQDVQVTYIYERAAGQDVTVKYVDEEGNELADSETLTGKIGDSYTTTAKTIAGWALKETPANATGTFSKDAQTVTYVYEKVGETSKQVTVKHQDSDGNKLADDDVFTVNTGDTYQTEAKTIEGYQVARIEGEPTGTMGTQDVQVTYIYERAAGQDVTVKYVDEEGNELADSETMTGKIGDSYTTTAKAIAGWTLKETPANATGTFSKDAQTVTYVYEKEDSAVMPPSDNEKPAESDALSVTEDDATPSEQVTSNEALTLSETKKNQSLPKTGDTATDNSMWAGLGLLLVGLAILGVRKTGKMN
ncbi:MucBP domain-containing protein [Listeria ilorinensis]|uniref:MucBP domain-containing protein n=1 Tax=Listeria ilorinensis TaxID=2867439 RepID=UPI001EF4BAEC|nr:MucBP domain-containing protein [Listeria ilorinensis]